MGFGAGTAFGKHGCFCSQSRSANKEILKYFQSPRPGKLKCSFHKCFSIWLTVCCFCGHLCLCLGKKREKKKKKKTETTNPPPACCGQKCRGDPDCFGKALGSCAKGCAAAGKHQARTDSAVPSPAPQSLQHSPQGLLARRGPAQPGIHVSASPQ